MAKGDGWVYVLTNEAMPGLVKVGCTSKIPEIRAEELFGETSAPGPFVVAYAAFVPIHKQVETTILRELKAAGFHNTPEKPKKEFFRCDPFDAIECIRKNADIKYEQLNEECIKYEEGSISYKDGSAYSGDCKISSAGLKLPHGHGSWTHPDGDRYVGEWKEGIWHGEGSLTIPGVGEYVGRWENGEQNGYGTHTDSDGDKYTGEWKDGEKEGQGTRTWPNGRVYVGEFKNGLPDGEGGIPNLDPQKMLSRRRRNRCVGGKFYITWLDPRKFDCIHPEFCYCITDPSWMIWIKDGFLITNVRLLSRPTHDQCTFAFCINK